MQEAHLVVALPAQRIEHVGAALDEVSRRELVELRDDVARQARAVERVEPRLLARQGADVGSRRADAEEDGR